MPLTNHREFWNPDRIRRVTASFGILNRFVPGDPALEIEVDRAPDSAGAPGTYATIARLPPMPRSGGWFWDPLPNDNATRWYRARHVGSGVTAGAYSTAVSGVPRQIDDAARLALAVATSPYVVTSDINAAAVTPTEAQGRNRARARKSANQTVLDAIQTYLTWNTEDYDVGGLHDNSTNTERFTIPAGGATGLWFVHAHIEVHLNGSATDNGTGARAVRIWHNNTTEIGGVRIIPTSGFRTEIDCIGWVNAPAVGDYLTVSLLSTAGASVDVASDRSYVEVVHVW